MSTTSVPLEWAKVDMVQMANDLKMSLQDLRKEVGLLPFPTFREALENLMKTLIEARQYNEYNSTEFRQAISDALECAEKLEDFRQLEEIQEYLKSEERAALENKFRTVSLAAINGVSTAIECSDLYTKILVECCGYLLRRWFSLLATKEDFLKFKFFIGTLSEPMKRLYWQKLAEFYPLTELENK